MAILEKMGIFGWKEEEENLLLASILTGDPVTRKLALTEIRRL